MYVCMYVYVCLCVCLCVNMPKNDILRSMPYVYAYYLYYNLYIKKHNRQIDIDADVCYVDYMYYSRWTLYVIYCMNLLMPC